MDDPARSTLYACLLLFLVLLCLVNRSRRKDLDHIPTFGPSGLVSSYLGGLRFMRRAREITVEGYQKHRDGVFKVAFLDQWHVFCCSRQLVDDVRKAQEDELSMHEAIQELLQSKYTLGEKRVPPCFLRLLKTHLEEHLSDLHDEIVCSFEDQINPPLGDKGWMPVPALDTVSRIACRATNRLVVGLPLCRDPDYINLALQLTTDVVKDAAIIKCFPVFLRPLVAKYAVKLPAYVKRVSKHLSPILARRMRDGAPQHSENNPKEDTFNDWFWSGELDKNHTLRDLAGRVLNVNFASVHTSSMSFTHALFHLAANPEYAEVLRSEVEAVLASEDSICTRKALGNMVKIDSFLKESQRVNGLGSMTMTRKVMKDFRFSDGTIVPAGVFVSIPLFAVHHDPIYYKHPDVFNPWRFVTDDGDAAQGRGIKDGGIPRVTNPEASQRRQMVALTADFLAWGSGRHACPGRFVAVSELKLMLAHVVTTYDVKLENEGVRPPNEWFAEWCIPNRHAKVLFRRRHASN